MTRPETARKVCSVEPLLIILAAVWGAAAGLFVPRAAYRLSVEPEEDTRDACHAGHPLTGPARGWLGRAHCRDCGRARAARTTVTAGTAAGAAAGAVADTSAPTASLPAARYAPELIAPLVTALVCAALAAATGTRPELVVWLLLAPVVVLLGAIDLAVHRLPDVLTLPLAVATTALLGVAALLPESAGSWPNALLGGLALGGGYFVLFLINPKGMGFGDVKLAVSLGIALGWYGWPVLFVGAFAGFLFGSVYGLGLVALRRGGRKTAIPFGPFMAAGTLTGLLLGALGA